jgi:GTPase SAR1 family protein
MNAIINSEPSPAGKIYTASLSQTQGRTGWSVIFRHPARRDDETGKFGVRVRRGLRTRDETDAEHLRGQLNELLADTKFHDPAARAEALRRGFDERIVDIFYDKMVPEEADFRTLRNNEIRLPDAETDDYRRVLLLGTTGAGKTTLVRQLIGTDPESERFPSTSPGKTTVHDTEIVIDDGPWRAVVTFVPSDEVREYLGECASAAVLAAWRGAPDGEILRRLLNHVNQRYRFSHVLGIGPATQISDFDDDEEEVQDTPRAHELSSIDLTETNRLLARAVITLKKIAQRHGAELRDTLEATSESDERVIDELFEEELDNLVREDEEFHRLNDELLDEIEKRFELLEVGEVRRTKQGWPLLWLWETSDRQAFLRAVSRFSSNYAKYFGQLLTPLVNGVRVAGPFGPKWLGENRPKLAILDGEGLGHTPKTSSSVSTNIIRRIEEVDAVVLVDNAAQPMQAAPVAAMRELVSSGNASKLIIAFTHFDEIRGDNLTTPTAMVSHVLGSAENVTASIGEDLGPFAERAIRKRLETARVFLAGIDKPMSPESKWGARTISQFDKLLQLIADVVERPEQAEAKPRYDVMDIVLAVKSAAENFHDAWFTRLGLEQNVGWGKEHWTRVKALSRRLATGQADHYDTLHPVADLRKELLDRIYVFVQNPLGWTGAEPSDDQKQAIFDAFADAVAKRMLILSTQRIWKAKASEWGAAYHEHGTGSTFVRARIIGQKIFEPAAPIPDITPSVERNLFLRDVVSEVRQAAEAVGVFLV